MKNTAAAILVGVGCALLLTTGIRAQVTKPAVPKTSSAKVAADPALPAPVAAAFKKAYPDATIKHVSKETENGKTIYEVESIDRGLARDINFRPDGTIVVVEEAIAPADVPAPVASAIKARYPKATISTREKMTTGRVITYEFALAGASVKSVELTPDGKFVSPK